MEINTPSYEIEHEARILTSKGLMNPSILLNESLEAVYSRSTYSGLPRVHLREY